MPVDHRDEMLISVDVETAGPNPGNYSMLSIGACLVDDPEQGFYAELKPVNDNFVAGALEVSNLSMEQLSSHGEDPTDAMARFEQWIGEQLPATHRPVFLGFNTPFDWMFVCDYFERFLGRNPFGHSAIDIKSYYLGMTGGSWAETSMRHLAPRYLADKMLSHNALSDAEDQARLFSAIRADANSRRPSNN